MADATTTTATPPATSGGTLTIDAVNKAIADALAPVTKALGDLSQNQKVIADTIAADAATKASAAAAAAGTKAKPDPADAPKPLTQDDVNRLVKEGITNALSAQQQAAQSTAAREAFIADKLKGVPPAYAAKLGNDPAKWAEQEQAIRGELKADLAAMGVTPKDVSGEAGGQSASTAGTQPQKTNLELNMTPGQAAYAKGLQMPA